MAYNFLRGDRDQPFLLPPDLRDWLPDGHLAWFVLDVVDQMDLAAFYRAHRNDGHGHPALRPQGAVGCAAVCLLCRGALVSADRAALHRGSCLPDPGQQPVPRPCDHRPVPRPARASLADFLVQSLRLCAAAGMVRVGLVALDGTKVAANAADRANRTLAKLQEEVTQILREVAETDQAEDRDGRARGAELPPELASPAGRLARLRQAKAQLEAEAAERQRRYEQRVAELAAAARARGQQPRPRITPRRRDEAPDPKATANTTDPDSRYVRGSGRTPAGL
jgi:hypothetical protein